jgi:hypothetical protein
MTSIFPDFKVGSIKVKDTGINETTITPGLLTMNNGNTLTLTASSLSTYGPFTISNATLGATTGVTVTSTDNSTNLATTAFVKAQSYVTSAILASYATTASLVEYAKSSLAQTWSALQTFSSGIATNLLNATTATSVMTIGSNMTTGTVTLGTSTSSTTLNGNTAINSLSAPITPAYSYPLSFGKVGYTIYLNGSYVGASTNNPVSLLTIPVPKGVWLITSHANISSSGNSTYSFICINSNTGINGTVNAHNQPSGTWFTTDISLTVVIQNINDANEIYYLVGQLGFAGGFYSITTNMCKMA